MAYVVDDSNQDNFPLMFPWHEPPWIPYASFNYSSLQPRINETVTFEALNSYDFDGEIVQYLWDFGDGILTNETISSINHTYTYPGIYTITLTVIDNEGLSNTTQKTITPIKISSNLSISTTLSTLILKQNATLYGSLTPARSLTNVTIRGRLIPSNNWILLTNVTTDEEGNYSYNWIPSISGTYVIKATWTGDEYTVSSGSETLIVTCTRIPTSISIITDCSSTLNGFKVEAEGRLLEIYGTGLRNETVVLSYTFAGIQTWTPITSDTTNDFGEYQTTWFPPATGDFLLKAEWIGDLFHLESNNSIAVSTVSFDDQYVFTVESNSTIADLLFHTTSRRLSFTATGENNTKGYTRVTIAKTLIQNVTEIKVKVDGNQLNYTASSLDDSWHLYFTYLHSTHEVAINLGALPVPITPTPSGDITPFITTPLGIAVLFGVPIIVVVILVILYTQRKKHNR